MGNDSKVRLREVEVVAVSQTVIVHELRGSLIGSRR